MAYIENTLPYLPQEIWDKIYDKKEEIELYELRKFDTKLFIQDIPGLIQFIDFWENYRLLLRDDTFNDHPLHTEFKNQIITSNISDFRQITDHMFSHTVWKFLEMMLYKNLDINPIFLEKLLNYFTCKCNGNYGHNLLQAEDQDIGGTYISTCKRCIHCGKSKEHIYCGSDMP